jgi:hypothetical protein
MDRTAPVGPFDRTQANYTRAVELYERAASSGSVPALNGLGFAYFNGHHLPQAGQHTTCSFVVSGRYVQSGHTRCLVSSSCLVDWPSICHSYPLGVPLYIYTYTYFFTQLPSGLAESVWLLPRSRCVRLRRRLALQRRALLGERARDAPRPGPRGGALRASCLQLRALRRDLRYARKGSQPATLWPRAL